MENKEVVQGQVQDIVHEQPTPTQHVVPVQAPVQTQVPQQVQVQQTQGQPQGITYTEAEVKAVVQEYKQQMDAVQKQIADERLAVVRGSVKQTLKARGMQDNLIKLVLKSELPSADQVHIDQNGQTILGQGDQARTIQQFCDVIVQEYHTTQYPSHMRLMPAQTQSQRPQSETDKLFSENNRWDAKPRLLKDVLNNGFKIYMENQ